MSLPLEQLVLGQSDDQWNTQKQGTNRLIGTRKLESFLPMIGRGEWSQ